MAQSFNPDLMYSDAEKAKLFSSIQNIKNACVAEMCCPYDRAICYIKVKRFAKWRNAICYLARNHVNTVIHTRDGVEDPCPVKYQDCVRYQQHKLRKKHGR